MVARIPNYLKHLVLLTNIERRARGVRFASFASAAPTEPYSLGGQGLPRL